MIYYLMGLLSGFVIDVGEERDWPWWAVLTGCVLSLLACTWIGGETW